MMSRNDKRNSCKVPKSIRRYPVNCDARPKEVFDMPFLSDNKTISYIKNHKHIMFIIRGPPYTMKTKLSDLLKENYPDAIYCSAVKHIDKYASDGKMVYDKNIRVATHEICKKLADNACKDNKLVIVQNSHMKKHELQHYLKLAVLYDYTVIMAITTYKFDITIEALDEAEKHRNGVLGHQYLKTMFKKWEDVPPMYTGWFFSHQDSECLRYLTLQTLETLFQCEAVREHSVCDDIANYFHPRQMLSCLAGYTTDEVAMKNYYLSDLVQLSYGKCFNITIVGYLVTTSDIIGIVHLNSDMKSLTLYDLNQDTDAVTDLISGTLSQHGKTKEFHSKENSKPGKIAKNDWLEGEEINIAMSSFIHIAQKSFNVFNLQKLRNDFNESLQMIADANGIIHKDVYTISDDGTTKFCKLTNDALLVKAPQKILTKAIFTGFYPD